MWSHQWWAYLVPVAPSVAAIVYSVRANVRDAHNRPPAPGDSLPGAGGQPHQGTGRYRLCIGGGRSSLRWGRGK